MTVNSANRGLSAWMMLAPAIFLLVLPFSHTVSLRLLSLFVLFLTAMVFHRRFDAPPIPFKLPLLLWLAMALVSLTWAVDPGYSLSEIKVEIGYAMLAFAGFFVLAVNRRMVVYALMVIVIVASVVSVAIWFREHTDMSAWSDLRRLLPGVGNTSTWLVTVLPVLILFFALIYRHVDGARRSLVIAAGIVAVLIVLLGVLGSSNRMAWFAMAVEAGVFLILFPRISARHKLLAALLIIVLTVVGYTWVSMQKSQMEDVSFTSIKESISKDERVKIWKNTLPILMNKPLSGEGFGRRALAKSHQWFSGETWHWHAHNLFLNYWAQTGLFGVIALAFLFAAIAWRFFAYLRYGGELYLVGVTGICVVVGVLSKNMTDDFFNRDLALLFWAIIGLLSGWGERLRQTALSVDHGSGGASAAAAT